jgi:hypothetical protein
MACGPIIRARFLVSQERGAIFALSGSAKGWRNSIGVTTNDAFKASPKFLQMRYGGRRASYSVKLESLECSWLLGLALICRLHGNKEWESTFSLRCMLQVVGGRCTISGGWHVPCWMSNQRSTQAGHGVRHEPTCGQRTVSTATAHLQKLWTGFESIVRRHADGAPPALCTS